MKKSSSLESLQTMVHEVTATEGNAPIRVPSASMRGVPRGRGCNESFRAAVDRSYEAPLGDTQGNTVMDTLAEEETDSVTAAGVRVPPFTTATTTSITTTTTKQSTTGGSNKKQKGLLKGLGSMFRFGKHRKGSDSVTPDSNTLGQHYTSSQDTQQVSVGSFPQDLPTTDPEDPDDSEGAPYSRTERMHQLRAEHQRRHAQRNRTYPSDGAEDDTYDRKKERLSSIPPQPSDPLAMAAAEYGLSSRPGSRGGSRGAVVNQSAGTSLLYAHYANYQQIQQHLRSEEQERLKQLASQQYRDFREKHHNRRPVPGKARRPHTAYYEGTEDDLLRRLEQAFIDDAISNSRECREYQSQRGTRDTSNSLASRPVSNYFEYESVQAMMSHAGGRGTPPSSTIQKRVEAPAPPAALHRTRGGPGSASYSSTHSATGRARQFTAYNGNNFNGATGDAQQPYGVHPQGRGTPADVSYDHNDAQQQHVSAASGGFQNYNNNNSSSGYHVNSTSHHHSKSLNPTSSSSGSGNHNSLPRRTHQHFTDNLSIVTARHNYNSAAKQSLQQKGIHAPVPLYQTDNASSNSGHFQQSSSGSVPQRGGHYYPPPPQHAPVPTHLPSSHRHQGGRSQREYYPEPPRVPGSKV